MFHLTQNNHQNWLGKLRVLQLQVILALVLKGSIIGKGCKTAALLDDPIKNPEEALNEGFIERLELFIEAVHNTCIDPSSDCAQIIISTRWTDNDPIGQRLNDPTWVQFTFPALDENNKSICEDIISTKIYLQ